MRLTVLNVAYPFAPVGPDAAGGAEQVLTRLDAALVSAGYRSLVAACEGSLARGELVATVAVDGALPPDRHAEVRAAYGRAIAHVFREVPIDLVHMHGLDFLEYLPAEGPPVLATLHLPPEWYSPEIWTLPPARVRLNCVSHAQRARCPVRTPPDVIENGVPLPGWPTDVRRRGFALCLGRICPEKGWHLAIEAAARAGVPLLLAGAVFPYAEHVAYFEREIAPRLGRRCRYIGPVGQAAKGRLLAAARCLLVPSLVAETSSLVAMEALACGTPVVALATGALPEVVVHGETGFVVDDVAAMASALRMTGRIRPGACRTAATARFDAARMCAEYLELYARMTAQRASRAVRDREVAAC